MLTEEFLKPLGMSNGWQGRSECRAAHRRDPGRRRAITTDTDLRLRRFFALSDGWWLRRQADYDTEVAKASSRRLWRRSGRGRKQ
jgi:hypothetical protein